MASANMTSYLPFVGCVNVVTYVELSSGRARANSKVTRFGFTRSQVMVNAERLRGSHAHLSTCYLIVIVFQLIVSVQCTRGNRILFIHVPKCGGSSVKEAFRKMKSFTLWTNHAYDWDDFVARELRSDQNIPNNLIVEHHVASKPFAEAHRDRESLTTPKKIWVDICRAKPITKNRSFVLGL